jgi:iron complex outermembrane recepter protein
LRTVDSANPFLESSPLPLHLVIPEIFSNRMHGDTYGAEISSTLTLFDWWTVSPGYSWLKMNLHPEPGSFNLATFPKAAGDSPQHQFQLRSHFDLPHNFEFDPAVYYVDRLPDQGVPRHTRLDARFSWHPFETVEFDLVGQNLLEPRHLEFGSMDQIQATQIQRSVFGEIKWRF